MKREYIAAAAFGIVFLYAYSKGVFSKGRGREVTAAAATDGSTPNLSNAQYINKATAIHNSLSQTYFQGFGGDLWTILNDLDNLKDADLIAVSNEYARLYPNDPYPTLYSLIESVTAFYFSETYTLKYKILERLKKLGL